MLINIFGKRGAGKTTLIRNLIQSCPQPAVVVDILGNYKEYDVEEENFDESEKQVPNSISTSDISEALELINNYLQDPENQPGIIIVEAQDPSLTIDYVSSALYEAECGTLVLDEADAFDLSEAPCYDWVIRYGRNKNVHVVTGVRRPAELSKNITAAANKMYAFGTHEPRDIEYFEKTIFGPKAEELIKVEKFSGIFVDYDKGILGNFRMDKEGQVYHTSEEPIK